MQRLGLAMLLLVASGAQAEMTTSPRPQARPAAAVLLPQAKPVPSLGALPESLVGPKVRPLPRPATIAALPQAADLAATPVPDAVPVVRPMPRPAALGIPVPALLAVTVAQAPSGMVRPKPRPAEIVADVVTASAPAKPERGGLASLFGNRKPKKPDPVDGFVCGDPDIRGEELAPIGSKVKGCGIDEPVRVTSVDGIRLRGSATIDCTTATALKAWINKGMRPAFSKDVVELQIAGSYVCRPRNNIRGNKISEHGRGKAVDISTFVFADGSEWSISRDYNRQIRKAHKAACGIFGTTLGPGSDGYHEDHLHFDTASYRSGPYCR